MYLYISLNREEILEALMDLAVIRLPEDLEGKIEVSYNDDDGIDIFIYKDDGVLN